MCFVNSLTSITWAQGNHQEQFARIHPSLCASRTEGGWAHAFSRRICFIPAFTTSSLWDLSDSAGPRFLTQLKRGALPLHVLSSLYSGVYRTLSRETAICSLYWLLWVIRHWYPSGCIWFHQWLPAEDLPAMVSSHWAAAAPFIVYLVMSSLAL